MIISKKKRIRLNNMNIKYNILNNEILSPLDQFEIRDLFTMDGLGILRLSLTNIGLYLVIGVFFIFFLNILGTNFNKLISNN
jgi:hypothetical protein